MGKSESLRSAGRRSICKRPRKKIIAVFALIILLSCLLLMFTACNNSGLTSGEVREKVYGNPIVSSLGPLDFRVGGKPDFYVKIVDGEAYQWLRVDSHIYDEIFIGQILVVDSETMKAVSGMFG